MGARQCFRSTIVSGGLLGVGLALSGCGQSKCLDCGGDTPCPSFLGTYVGEQKGGVDDCQWWDLLEGVSLIQVVAQDGNQLQVENQDERGLWGIYDGQICNTNDQQAPRSYKFTASYDNSEVGSDFQLFYTMTGRFTEADGASPARVDGTLTISLFFPGTAEADCVLSGAFDGERTE